MPAIILENLEGQRFGKQVIRHDVYEVIIPIASGLRAKWMNHADESALTEPVFKKAVFRRTDECIPDPETGSLLLTIYRQVDLPRKAKP